MRLKMPFEGTFRISQRFRENPENYKKFSLAGHDGLDWTCPTGTKLLSPMDGKTYVGWAKTTWGLYYTIENDWGTVYLCHLKENYLPSDSKVTAGQLIGETDNTGNSTGPHLHVGLRVKGITDPTMKDFVDPLLYFQEEKPESVVISGQDAAIEQYQRNIGDLNEVLRLPVGNKDFAIIKQKSVELMTTKENYEKFVKAVAQGIGCADQTEEAVLEALVGLEARISAIKRQKLEEFGIWERFFSGLTNLILRKKGGEK